MRARPALLALAVAACHPPPPVPGSTVAAWTAALAKDDPAIGYQLLSAATRRQVSAETFAARWRDTTAERRAQAAGLSPATPVVESALLHLPDGRSIRAVRESQGWRLAGPRPIPPGAPTPEEAVRRFVVALTGHDFDGVLALLAEPLRSMVERELAERVLQLQAARPHLRVEGDRAQVRGERFRLDLIRENAEWRVADFN